MLKKVFSHPECRFLFILLFGFSLLRLPSLFEPNWYGDEGIYQVLGRAMNAGRMLYSEIWDNKPPLLYVTYALVDANHFLVRLLSYIAGLFAVYGFYLLTKRLFSVQSARFIATTVFAFLFAIPATEANIANAENFMLVFLIFAGFLVFSVKDNLMHTTSLQKLFVAGILVAVAFLYKIVAVFDFAAFFLFLLFLSLPERLSLVRTKNLKTYLRPVLVFSAGCIAPIILTGLYFLLVGAFAPFLTATFTTNVSYVGWRNYFLIPQGLLLAKLLLLGLFVLFLFSKRVSLGKTALFVLLWFAFSLFGVFFSQRPYTHYILMGITSFSLLIGLLISEKRFRILSLILIIIGTVLVISIFKPIRPKWLLGYYTNFIAYIAGQKSLTAYQAFFDSDMPGNYEIAQFISRHTQKNDIIFIWGNTAQIYTLSDTLPPGRYTVAYHITSSQAQAETQAAIDQKRARYIVLQSGSDIPQFLLTAYTQTATISDATIYERTR